MPTIFSRRALLLAMPASLAFAGHARAGLFSRPIPEDLDRSLARLTESGLYRATLSPGAASIPIGRMQVWTVALQTAGGASLTKAAITVDGGMPQHGHGLPTAPQVTRYLGDGRYQIEGVKFNMHGWWTFVLAITASSGRDVVAFNLVL